MCAIGLTVEVELPLRRVDWALVKQRTSWSSLSACRLLNNGVRQYVGVNVGWCS